MQEIPDKILPNVEYEHKSEQEQTEFWKRAVLQGIKPMNISRFNFLGVDGKYHYTTEIWNIF